MRKLLVILVLSIHIPLNAANREAVIAHIIKAADTVQVPRELLLALCWAESSYRTNLPLVLDGHSPSYGICQVKLDTAAYVDKVYKHRHHATGQALLTPFTNALYAGKYLKLQMKRYKGNWQLALDAYNRGYGKTQQSKYVKRVVAHMDSRPWANLHN